MVVFVQTWKPAALAALIPSTAAAKAPVPLDQPVVRLLHAVQVDVDEQPAAGAELGELLRQQHAVGAEVHVFAPGDDLLDQLADFGIDQRLAAADAHDRRAALVDRARHCSSVSRWPTVSAYSRIRPQPVQVRLQACSGSSISTSGKCFRPRSRF